MKRNFLLAIAVTALMVTSTIAQAADVTFSGQIRPRFNLDQDSSTNTNTSNVFDTRVRLNAKANVNENTEVFMQFQSIGSWGVNDADNNGTRQSNGGGGDQANDNLNDVGFHQAYLTLKNLQNTGLTAKIGRQEIVLEGHRIFGNTIWTQGAQSHDAVRMTHAGGNHTVEYAWIQANNVDDPTTLTNSNSTVHLIHTKTQGVLGGALAGYFTMTNDNSDATANEASTWFTLGARQAGKMAGLDYRVEYYHQLGDAGQIALDSGYGITGATSKGSSVARDANMLGIRVGKTFSNNASVTLWYDRLSGVDDDDQADGDWGAFDTMYDTGHKFYGYQDMYLNRSGTDSDYYGLQDIALKVKMPIKTGLLLKADLHHFRTATDLSGGDADAILTSLTDAAGEVNSAMSADLGTEIDLTLVSKYDANTIITLGYSHYFTTDTFGQVNGFGNEGSEANEGADWAYVMVDTKF